MQIEGSSLKLILSPIDSIAAQAVSSIDDSNHAANEVRFTIFSLPKPFVGDSVRIQRNAINSWKRLKPQAEIMLLGDDAGIAEVAAELGVKHVAGVQRNEFGTPRLDAAFAMATKHATTPFLIYCNCDVIFLDDLVEGMNRLAAAGPAPFLGYGRRKDVPISDAIDFDSTDATKQLTKRIRTSGRLDSIVCKEYFVFRCGTFAEIPPFAVGRGNWDNWMIRAAKERSMPVIDLSEIVTAIHQQHDYSHIGRNRWKCYVAGPEALENQRLAGGRHLISGSTPTWKLTRRGLTRVPLSQLNWAFWKDSHRFLRLMKDLVFG
jgi:hypothetical protein